MAASQEEAAAAAEELWPSEGLPLAGNNNNCANNEPAQLDGIDLVGQQQQQQRLGADNGAPLNSNINGLLARQQLTNSRPLILITDNSNESRRFEHKSSAIQEEEDTGSSFDGSTGWQRPPSEQVSACHEEEERTEVVDGIRYRIVAAVTKPAAGRPTWNQPEPAGHESKRLKQSASGGLIGSMRRKSSAFVANLLQSNQQELGANLQRPRRLSIYEMTKSPPPETSLEMYLSERRRSSTVSAKQVQQQLEQQTTFEANYNQRQQYFKDLNQRLINHDKKLLNVVANRGRIQRHSVDIAQLPLHLASKRQQQQQQKRQQQQQQQGRTTSKSSGAGQEEKSNKSLDAIDQSEEEDGELEDIASRHHLLPLVPLNRAPLDDCKRDSLVSSVASSSRRRTKTVIRKFQKLDSTQLNSTPAPDVKIGQRVAYKEYYGNEFGTIRWIGRVPQICPDWTAGIEFDNAIGEGDGSLNGRRYFIAKDCFAKFLPLNLVALVDQHVGRPEPGTMISVMSAAVRPGQMISIQRVSTVHVQHCFLNAPHHRPTGAEILAVNSRLHCQCPNCGPCAHVIKPPRTQRLARSRKNATHMCQFSTYTCCGMESQEEALCTYTGNKVSSLPPPRASSVYGLPAIGNSWMEGSGYLSQLQAQQTKLMPEEYRIGAAPEDIENASARRRLSRSSSSRRGSGKHQKHHKQQQQQQQQHQSRSLSPNPIHPQTAPSSPVPDHYLADSQYSAGGHLALACLDGKTLDDSDDRQQQQQQQPPPPGKIVYRDSIENRYLFPTDEPIDSTLEADLENLSQARYGQHVNSRRLTSSRNIFKSLRSLVSCLSAQSNHNSEHHSENTFRYYSQQGTPSYNKQLGNKQSLPESQSQHEYCVQSISSSTKTTTESHHICDSCHQPLGADDQMMEGKSINCAQDLNRRQVSSSSDCGFSSASQNSINFQSFTGNSSAPTRSLAATLDDERRTQQIYQRIATRLINTTELSSQDMAKLRRVIFEGQSLDNSNDTYLTALNTTNLNYLEADRIIADIIRKSDIIDKQQQQQIAVGCLEKCCSNSENAHARNDSRKSPENDIHHCHCDQQRAKRSSFVSDDSLASANEDIHSAGEPTSFASGKVEIQGEERVANKCKLQRAFELKLTLSINPDKASQQPATSNKDASQTNVDDSSNPAISELLNSTLSINIATPQQLEANPINRETTPVVN